MPRRTALLAALEDMQPSPPDLEFLSFVTTSALPMQEGVPRTQYRHRIFFVGSDVGTLAATGQLDYVPITLEDVPSLLASGRLPIDQGAGLGSLLQARLQEYAVSRGVRGFVAEILPRNARMLRLAAGAPGTVTTSRDEDAVHVTILFAGGV